MDEVVTTSATDTSTPAAVVSTTPTTETPAASPPARPTSMRDAFDKAQAKLSAPPGAATTQPAETKTPDGTPTATKGPIPFDVHETSMRNAREKTRAEVETEYQTKYGWVENQRSQIEQAVQLANLYSTDKAGYVRQLLSEAANDPTLAPVVRSEAARIMGAHRNDAAIDLEPDISVSDANGQIVSQTYSAQKVQAIVQKAVQDALAKEVAPLKQAHEATQHREALQQIDATAKTQATEVMGRASKWEGFTEHKKEIAEAFRLNPSWTVEQAYLDVLHRVILPSRDRSSQAQTMASLKDKAVAQVETTTGTAAAPGKKLKTPQDLARFMESRAGRR